MPTILTHPAVPLALSLALRPGVVSKRLLLAGVVVSMLPDLDVIAFRLGIPYAAAFGHRGFSHSLLFAVGVAVVGAALFRRLASAPGRVFAFLFAATASHGALDAVTNGGLGIAFLWPFSTERFFAPIQVIQVAPIGISRFLSERGVTVIWSEFLWVWLPLMTLAVMAIVARRYAIADSRGAASK